MLSQQFLVTSNSSSLLICNFINNKINEAMDLYNSRELEGVLIFKYKEVKIDINQHESF